MIDGFGLNLSSHKIDPMGRALFSGKFLFQLKTTHGLPLDFALDKVINEQGLTVDWVEFIQEARKNGWWDFQTYEALCHAMIDAELPKETQQGIKAGFQKWVVANPHHQPRSK